MFYPIDNGMHYLTIDKCLILCTVMSSTGNNHSLRVATGCHELSFGLTLIPRALDSQFASRIISRHLRRICLEGGSSCGRVWKMLT